MSRSAVLLSLSLLYFVAVCSAVHPAAFSVDSEPGFLAFSGRWASAFYNETRSMVSVINKGVSAEHLENNLKSKKTDLIITACGATRGPQFVNVPAGVTGIALIAHIPQTPPNFQVNLTPNQIAGIFSGRITKWSGVAENNPYLLNNDLLIKPEYVDGPNALNYAFTEFLATAASDWKDGASYNPTFGPHVRTAATETDLLRELVAFPGSIGFLSVPMALTSPLQKVRVLNKAGVYLEPSVPSVYLGASRVNDFPSGNWGEYHISRPDGKGSYPIPLFYCYVTYADLKAQSTKGCAIVDFLRFTATPERQNAAPLFHFSPLPPNHLEGSKRAISTISTNCPAPVEYVTPPGQTRVEFIEQPAPCTTIDFKFGNIVRKKGNYYRAGCN